jgi:glucokinase
MLNTADSLAIGLDVGGTKIAAALVGTSGQILAADNVKTHVHLGVDSLLDQIAGLINELAKWVRNDTQLRSQPLLGIGIGIPGRINPQDGIVRNAVNLGLDEVHLVDELRTRLSDDYPIWVDTDTNASTLGEFYFGAA